MCRTHHDPSPPHGPTYVRWLSPHDCTYTPTYLTLHCSKTPSVLGARHPSLPALTSQSMRCVKRGGVREYVALKCAVALLFAAMPLMF